MYKSRKVRFSIQTGRWSSILYVRDVKAWKYAKSSRKPVAAAIGDKHCIADEGSICGRWEEFAVNPKTSDWSRCRDGPRKIEANESYKDPPRSASSRLC